MRERINDEIKIAMKGGDKARLSTLRMINAAIKDRDIAARVDSSGKASGVEKVGDEELLQLLQKMVKQRRESIETYRSAGREELVAQESAEIEVIEDFLPKQMSDDEVARAVDEAIASSGAESVKDMGKVMAELKGKYAGRMDFGKASGRVKAALS